MTDNYFERFYGSKIIETNRVPLVIKFNKKDF